MNANLNDYSTITSTDGSTPYYYSDTSSNTFEGDATWYDSDFQKDKAKIENDTYPLKNDDPFPCDTCPFANKCEISGKECLAYRSFLEDGKSPKASDIGKELR